MLTWPYYKNEPEMFSILTSVLLDLCYLGNAEGESRDQGQRADHMGTQAHLFN